MSGIPQGSSTRSKKVIKEFSEDTKGRLIELFRRLENSSDQDVTVPTAAQIENILNSSLAPYLLVLSDHVVGHAQANHVRRQLRDLQNSNLPKSILSEVFPKDLTLTADHNLSSTFVSAKERTLNLEDECRNKEAERLHIINELERYTQKQSLLIELVSLATQTQVALEQFQKHIVILKSNPGPHLIADTRNTIPALISAIENPTSDEESSRLLTPNPPSNTFTPWIQLLESTAQAIEETALPKSPPVLPTDIATAAANTISGLKRVLMDLNSSRSDGGSIHDDTNLDSQLQGAKGYSNHRGREAIIELAKTNARTKILKCIHAQPIVQKETLESNEIRVEDLHKRTTRLLETTQALMRETKLLAVKLPGEIRGEISPIAAQLSALKSDLRGCIEARRMDAHDSIIDPTQEFSRQVCETLGLPPDTPSDVIYDYVRNLLSGSS